MHVSEFKPSVLWGMAHIEDSLSVSFVCWNFDLILCINQDLCTCVAERHGRCDVDTLQLTLQYQYMNSN